MNIDALKKKIFDLASEVAVDEGFELYDVQILGSGRKTILRIFIDKDGGVTIDDCEKMSKSLGVVLDIEDIIQSSYTLEVSSPGIDRPLISKRDFEKNIGKLVRITTSEMIVNQTFFIGRITDVGENWVRIAFDKKGKKEDLFIPLDKISKARLELEF